jgi:hypothetical protein
MYPTYYTSKTRSDSIKLQYTLASDGHFFIRLAQTSRKKLETRCLKHDTSMGIIHKGQGELTNNLSPNVCVWEHN